jgi:hypothetical protein
MSIAHMRLQIYHSSTNETDRKPPSNLTDREVKRAPGKQSRSRQPWTQFANSRHAASHRTPNWRKSRSPEFGDEAAESEPHKHHNRKSPTEPILRPRRSSVSSDRHRAFSLSTVPAERPMVIDAVPLESRIADMDPVLPSWT